MVNEEKISNANGNWFIAEIIAICEPANVNQQQDLRRCTVGGSYCLIKAHSPEAAYDKAEKLGKEGEHQFTSEGMEMRWSYGGIKNLLPVYDDIEDGAELIWADYGFISHRKARQLVTSKEDFLKEIKPKHKE